MDSLSGGLGSLVLDDKYTDLEIRCGGNSFKVHRTVVCNKSAVLAKQCDIDGEVRVLEDSFFDPKTVQRMLQFMYHGDYDIDLSDAFDLKSSSPRKEAAQDIDAAPKDPWAVAETLIAHLYASVIGERYEIAELKAMAAERFRKEGVKLESIPTACFVAIAEIVYRETASPSQLRSNPLKIAIKHRKTLLAEKESVQAIQKAQDLLEFEASLLQSLNKLVDAYYKISQENATAASKELESVKEQLEVSKRDTAVALQERNSFKDQLDIANKTIEQLKQLNRRNNCRHCGRRWEYKHEASDNGYLARCLFCQTRHFAPL